MTATPTPETPVSDYPRGLTFEQVWAMFQETDRKFQETDQKFQKSREEFDRKWQKLQEQMEKTDRQIGDLGNRFGELAEHLVAPNIMNKFNDLGFDFTKCSLNVVIKESGSRQALAGVDIMLENGDIVIAVKVKAAARQKDVEKHILRMERLRKAADLRSDKRRYQGAVAVAILGETLREEILQQGFYLIEQTGDTVQITIPEGFTPREW